MAIQLPKVFLERMQALLGEEEYAAFSASYDNPRFAGIRVNTLKVDAEAFREIMPFELRPIPWCGTGYYLEELAKPGKHPYYHAGLYYIQEPSAMAPVELLDVTPGERVLDLCAAPGGKSTQIAAKLRGSGLLVTNDINADRTKALAKNIELYGVRNAVVLGEAPERIARAFPYFFNKILVDAPCSGEGMFRKDEDMARLWEPEWIRKYAGMQREILRSAAALLAPGGRMVYSTCTFAPEENEATIADFLLEHPEFRVVPLQPDPWVSPGRPEWLTWLAEQGEGRMYPPEIAEQTAGCGRLWPHKVEGEGHFLAVLERQGEKNFQEPAADYGIISSEWERNSREKRDSRQMQRSRSGAGRDPKPVDEREVLESWRAFSREQLQLSELQGEPLLFGGNVYLSPLPKERLDGLKVVRPGWYVGTVRNGRLTPGQPLATALSPSEAVRVLNLNSSDGESIRYLKGETLQIEAERIRCLGNAAPKGYVLVAVDDYSLGWGKWQDGLLKNEYPAGWRWT
ncbi:RsmB/NOP family class I SAM-dependent RNA methyltransferase [Paenibacillus phocaensis]|uniref:RsmB/NOP family class I SAM-dependent RNA methyltransferase n=1 Tax=Paenibacillus phocaensis TaxID=1776378 RepID=UPI000839D5DC|nr:RsmB/NOP family class I SAM-dependent RNA methyltransferase [Paenibacillus phocaensis]